MASVVAERFINDTASGTLSAGVSAGATSWVLSTGHGSRFPASGLFRLRCDSEIVICTARTGDTLTVVRAAEGTTGASHATAAEVAAVLTAEAVRRWINDHCRQPRHHNLLGWSFPPGELGSSTDYALTALRETLVKVFLPEDPGAISRIRWMHTTTGATTAANVYGTVRNSSGVLVAKTAELVVAGSIPATAQPLSLALVAEPGHSLSELTGGPDAFCMLGVYAGTVGNLVLARRAYSGNSAMQNVGLTAGTDVLLHCLRSSTDAGGPPATINLLTEVGPDNQGAWIGLS